MFRNDYERSCISLWLIIILFFSDAVANNYTPSAQGLTTKLIYKRRSKTANPSTCELKALLMESQFCNHSCCFLLV